MLKKSVILKSSTVRFEGLDIARALATILVFYCHNYAAIAQAKGLEKGLVSFVRNYFLLPLGIIQDFGFFAVALFFLLSGFLMAYKGTKENLQVFLIKRVLRIYPAWIVAILLMQVVNICLDYQLVLSSDRVLNFAELWKCLSLYGYLELKPIWIIGVGWTLIIEVIFYALFAIVKIFGGKNILKIICLQLLLICLCVLMHDGGNDFIKGFNHWIPYIPCLIFGELIYAFVTEEKKIVCVLLTVVNYGVLIWSAIVIPESELAITNGSYLISLFYALLLFLLLLNSNVRCPAILQHIALISYSIYIYHGTIGQIVMLWLPNNLFFLSFVLSILVTITIANLSYFYIEKKGQVWSRKLIKMIS